MKNRAPINLGSMSFEILKTISIAVILAGFIVSSCKTTQKTQTTPQKVEVIETDTIDPTEYELIIMDPGFNSWLATQPPANYHSQAYYENWNQRYVTEWNNRHNNPIRYGDFYETQINYNAHEDYGLDLNYKLYYYFRFIEENYGIQLIRRRR